MTKRYRPSKGMRNLGSAAKFTGRATEKAASSLFRWATTDHTGFGKSLDDMPKMGFLDTVEYILLHIICSVVGIVLTTVIAYVLIVYGIPLFFSLMFNNDCATYIC